MRDEILTYWEMCARENLSLQRGMNFRQSPNYSIVLMSQMRSAPYEDLLSEDGAALLYEGHDVRRRTGLDPKTVDQPWEDSPGKPSENGKFAKAATDWRAGEPSLVRVYEKLKQGIWSNKGLFNLTGYDYEMKGSEGRGVFKFKLELTDLDPEPSRPGVGEDVRRIIPSWVKQAVFKRDNGQCVLCGSTDQLHFDHELPFSKGGASVLPGNIRILCARHNLSKGAKIQ